MRENCGEGNLHMARMIFTASALILSASILHAFEQDPAPKMTWQVHTINTESKFEAAGIGDINNDGKLDIVCGSYWYEAPDWKRHKITEQDEINGYFNDFANELQDVDGDGDLDIVNCAWFSKEVFWRENPGESGEWKTHTIDTPGNMETGHLFDLNQDDIDDFIPDLSHEVVWYEKLAQKPAWNKHTVGAEGKGHGLGVGDVNRSGDYDLVTPHGWYEGKLQDRQITWSWHPEFELGTASVPILVHDVNGDGLEDIVWGLGHDYGIFWLEQSEEDGQRKWIKHEIDKTWSQPHYIAIADLNNDGEFELVAGKRYYAHNGNDPGAEDPLCIYTYNYDREKKIWLRSIVSEGGRYGFGLNPAIADIDGDGDLDLVCPGKSGLYLFEQK